MTTIFEDPILSPPLIVSAADHHKLTELALADTGRAAQEAEDLLGVEGAVGDAHHGRRGGDTQETVLEHGDLDSLGRLGDTRRSAGRMPVIAVC